MKKILILVFLAALFAALAAPVHASDHKGDNHYNSHFGDMDLNGDDLVNWDELKAFFSHAKEDVFKKIDANNDGSIDHDEWHAFKEAQGYKHKE